MLLLFLTATSCRLQVVPAHAAALRCRLPRRSCTFVKPFNRSGIQAVYACQGTHAGRCPRHGVPDGGWPGAEPDPAQLDTGWGNTGRPGAVPRDKRQGMRVPPKPGTQCAPGRMSNGLRRTWCAAPAVTSGGC